MSQQQQNNKQEVFNWDEATIAMLEQEHNKYKNYQLQQSVENLAKNYVKNIDNTMAELLNNQPVSNQLATPDNEKDTLLGFPFVINPTMSNTSVKLGNDILQMQLNEPLFECKIGWYYNPNRTTTKRSNLPLRKKPSYRYAKTPDFVLGRKHEDLGGMLDLWLNSVSLRTCVVFIPNELWSRYPNEQSWYSPEPTSYVNVNVNDITLPPSTSLVVNEPNQTKISIWQKLINWFKN